MSYQGKAIMRRSVLLFNLALALAALVMVAPAQRSQTPAQGVAPAALIKNIVVNNQKLTEADRSQAVVTRTATGETLPASAGLLMYKGDVVETFANTKVTLLFLDAPVAERDNEVIVDSNARVGVSSNDSWWGRTWAKVKGIFYSRTDYVQLGSRGTEYEFNVFKNERRSTVVMLEGEVDVRKGRFSLAGSKERSGIVPEVSSPEALLQFPLFAVLAHRFFPQAQYGLALDVQSGQVSDVKINFNILNSCRQNHQFEFHKSDGADWLQMVIEQNVVVAPRERKATTASIRLDATRLAAGQYRASVYAVCKDCDREPRCSQAQLEWPINLTVKPVAQTSPTPSPSPLPTPVPLITPTPPPAGQVSEVLELEEAVLTDGLKQSDSKRQLPPGRVRSILAWSSNVILATQPTYTAQNIVPHFSTIEQRSQSFNEARATSILYRDEMSNKILGDIYNDWGQAAWAITAYEKAKMLGGQTAPDYFIDLVEAYRRTGQLQKAQDMLVKCPNASQSALGNNACGNLNLDYASIALDKGQKEQAAKYVDTARDSYQAALQIAPGTGQSGGGAAETEAVLKVNLAEAHLAAGNLANDTQAARTQYESARKALESFQQADSQYPFAATDLGRAYQRLGNVAWREGKREEEAAAYQKAEALHRQAIAAHPDFAEAYFNLGDLQEDMGKKEEAKNSYWRAIKARPEQPDSYYPLALLIQGANPRLAAALAATYLKLEPEAFKQGQRAKNAELISQGQSVEPPPRPITSTMKIVTLMDTVLVKVPNIVNKSPDKATELLKAKGLSVGQTIKRASCDKVGMVIEQFPLKDTKVAGGSKVDMVIGSYGDDAATVPRLTGLNREQVEQRLRDAGLKLGEIKKREDERAEEGSVINQNPNEGAPLARGCNVEITLATHIERVLVGDYVGQSVGEAAQLLNNTGLRVIPIPRASDAPEGSVIGQYPSPGSYVSKGSVVTLYVSKGAPRTRDNQTGVDRTEYVQLTNFDRMTEQAAKALIIRLRLTIGQVDYKLPDPDNPHSPGTVMGQSPAPNTRVKIGTPVNLTIVAPDRLRRAPPPPSPPSAQ